MLKKKTHTPCECFAYGNSASQDIDNFISKLEDINKSKNRIKLLDDDSEDGINMHLEEIEAHINHCDKKCDLSLEKINTNLLLAKHEMESRNISSVLHIMNDIKFNLRVSDALCKSKQGY